MHDGKSRREDKEDEEKPAPGLQLHGFAGNVCPAFHGEHQEGINSYSAQEGKIATTKSEIIFRANFGPISILGFFYFIFIKCWYVGLDLERR